jgi:hypothetical protein
MPEVSPELELDEGKIFLGGSCVSGDVSAWQCVECGMQIYCEKVLSAKCQRVDLLFITTMKAGKMRLIWSAVKSINT